MALIKLVNEVLQEAGRDPCDELRSGVALREDLGFDSLELAVLTVKIEAEYGVDVFADGIVNTIGEIEDKIGER